MASRTGRVQLVCPRTIAWAIIYVLLSQALEIVFILLVIATEIDMPRLTKMQCCISIFSEVGQPSLCINR
jgi:hypothetical protein